MKREIRSWGPVTGDEPEMLAGKYFEAITHRYQ